MDTYFGLCNQAKVEERCNIPRRTMILMTLKAGAIKNANGKCFWVVRFACSFDRLFVVCSRFSAV